MTRRPRRPAEREIGLALLALALVAALAEEWAAAGAMLFAYYQTRRR